MLNTQGTDRGGAQALEQAILPATAPDRERTQMFAWYNALQDVGGACGALLAALPALLRDRFELGEVRAYDATLIAYALLLAGAALAYARLSSAAERGAAIPPLHALHAPAAVRRAVRNFSLLAAMDAFGGGFIGSALIAYFLYLRFGASEGALAALFLAARVMTVLSHFVAAWLSRRIGLVNTMVFTHLPSGLLLLTLPLAPNLGRGGGAVHPPRGPVGDGRADAPVLPDGDRAGAPARLGLGHVAARARERARGRSRDRRRRDAGRRAVGAAGGRRADQDRLRPAAVARVPPHQGAGGAGVTRHGA